jgi:hypothetical protein
MKNKNKRESLLKKIDHTLFNAVDELKNKPEFSQFSESVTRIDDEIRDIAKLSATAVFLFLPFLLVVFLWMHNIGIQNDIEIRKDFIKIANEIKSTKNQIGESSRKIISSNPIEGGGGLLMRLSNNLTSVGVDVDKIQISDMSQEDIDGNLQRSEGDFKFTAITTEELSKTLSYLITREKMKISSIKVKKNKSSNLINGSFRVVHFSRVTVAVEKE